MSKVTLIRKYDGEFVEVRDMDGRVELRVNKTIVDMEVEEAEELHHWLGEVIRCIKEGQDL